MPLHLLKELELRDHCRRAIEALEFWLRRSIDTALAEAYGADYFSAVDEQGNNVINAELRRSLGERRDANPNRYARLIDAALLEDEIRIICNPNLYPRFFGQALNEAFPVGREQAKATLDRLVGPRNALSHNNPVSVREAEQVICYSGDVIESLKKFETPGRERTKKRRGKVPIPAKLLPHLRRARRRGSDVGYVLHINGKCIGNIKKGFAAACRRAGLKGVSPHTLRHTVATWLMQAGVPLWQAAGFLAMSEKTLREVYGHHHPDYLREAAEAISKRPQLVRGMSA